MRDKTKKVIRKITDVITILFPALIAIAGTLEMAGVIEILQTSRGIIMVGLGTASSIASVVFNAVTPIQK